MQVRPLLVPIKALWRSLESKSAPFAGVFAQHWDYKLTLKAHFLTKYSKLTKKYTICFVMQYEISMVLKFQKNPSIIKKVTADLV